MGGVLMQGGDGGKKDSVFLCVLLQRNFSKELNLQSMDTISEEKKYVLRLLNTKIRFKISLKNISALKFK